MTAAGRVAAYLTPREDVRRAFEYTQLAEELGYDSVWLTHGGGWDSVLLLTALGQTTRTIGLGTGVLPIYPRHPVALAEEALTLSAVSPGRFRLGIGVSHGPEMEERLGLEIGRPVEAMREYATVLRGALTGSITHSGPRYRVRWASKLPKVPPAPPVLLAGLSARMLELAGEIADGAVLWLCTADYVRDVAVPALARGRARAGLGMEGFEVVAAVHVACTRDVAIPALARGRARAGRGMEGFEVVSAVHVACTRDVAGVTRDFAQYLTRYLGLPFYRAMFVASGLGDELAAFDAACARGTPPADAVGKRLVERLAAIGSEDAVRASV